MPDPHSDPTNARSPGWRGDAVAMAMLALVCVALFLALPRMGDIYYPDSPRHAMNGAFVLDLVRTMPVHDPKGFALDYYRHWPALTILFYPPLFYAFLAAAYAIFGVSEATALGVELTFLFALAAGFYRLSAQFLPRSLALAAALLLIACPQVFFWGQQIMLDIPAFAFLIWSAVAWLAYRRSGTWWHLLACVLLAVAAVYTKYNAIFIAAVFGADLVWRTLRRGESVRLVHVAWAMVIAAVALLPLLVIFALFAGYNLEQAQAVAGDDGGRWSAAGLSYYARTLPQIIGWPALLVAALYPLALWRKRAGGADRALPALLLIWLALGYAFYAMIAVKEPRHFLFVVPPILIFAMAAIRALVPDRFALREAVAAILVLATFAQSARNDAPAYVTGPRAAADLVALRAPHDVNIGIWGHLDGTFIFALRANRQRQDLGAVRLDKLLLANVAVATERGFDDRHVSRDAFVRQVRDLHMQYVVVQSDYLADTPSVAAMYDALRGPEFEEVGRFAMQSNHHLSYLTAMVVYRLREPVAHGRVSPDMQIKLIGASI